MDGGGLGLVIGDVCGHGLGPALIMAATRSYLRFLSKSRPNPALVFEIINDVLYADLESNNYVAMILIRLDATARRFSYANAGHLAGYHLDPLGGVKTVLDSTGRPLGLFPGQTYECRENLQLEAGELVVLFTDGVPEAEDASGRTFGVENALSVIRAHYHESAERIVQSLCDAVRDFVGPVPQQDDITVVVCKVGSRA
jgi:sigma-B regulation protein RsbU (phosphoserine phosphatase)